VAVAEKLLQQTAVNERVVYAYEMILKKHPTVEHLAEASAKELLSIGQRAFTIDQASWF
jgi:adenine-specific DNA glycosylase